MLHILFDASSSLPGVMPRGYISEVIYERGMAK
jgi:hypothetical protein